LRHLRHDPNLNAETGGFVAEKSAFSSHQNGLEALREVGKEIEYVHLRATAFSAGHEK
jgi:hypothetical protein